MNKLQVLLLRMHTTGTGNISDEFSVTKIGNAYVMVTEDTGPFFTDQKKLLLYAAPAPTGPWTARTEFYSTPETGQNGIWSYNPHADWYRPLFLRIQLTASCPPR